MKFAEIIARYLNPRASPVVANNTVSDHIINRNPRNLERLRIAKKPSGYFLDRPVKNYWHKLEINESSRYVTAKITHNSGIGVVTASTIEWAVKKYLYGTKDLTAFVTVGKVIAQRCLESGITEAYYNFQNANTSLKVRALVEEIMKCGVELTEPSVYVHPAPSDYERPEKPWELQ